MLNITLAVHRELSAVANMNASTPIAILIEAMFANGAEDAAIVQAVEAAERSNRPSKSGTRLPADWAPSSFDLEYAASRGVAPPGQARLRR